MARALSPQRTARCPFKDAAGRGRRMSSPTPTAAEAEEGAAPASAALIRPSPPRRPRQTSSSPAWTAAGREWAAAAAPLPRSPPPRRRQCIQTGRRRTRHSPRHRRKVFSRPMSWGSHNPRWNKCPIQFEMYVKSSPIQVASFLRAYFGPIIKLENSPRLWSLVVKCQSLLMVVAGLFSISQIQTKF